MTMSDGALKGDVFAKHAATLVQLFLSSIVIPGDLFPNIGKHCKHLTLFTFQDSRGRNKKWQRMDCKR
jgi:hypothetical protein